MGGIAALVKTAGDLIGGGSAEEKAAKAQLEATNNSLALQWKMYDQGRADQAPWRQAGEKSLNVLWDKMNKGPGDYTKSPGYEFRLKEGEKALERSAAARGNVLSGAALKGLTEYGQNFATNDYDNFLRRYYESLTPYQALAGVGQSTAAQTAAMGANAGQNMGNTLLYGGNAQAAGYINAGNVQTGMLKNMQNGAQNGFANYLQWKNLNTPTNYNYGGGGTMPYPGAPDMSAVS